jgi:hypothetical protein
MPYRLDAKLNESLDLGWRMFASRMETEQREPFTVPVGKEID